MKKHKTVIKTDYPCNLELLRMHFFTGKVSSKKLDIILLYISASSCSGTALTRSDSTS